jgi:hypothetical protein
MERYNWSLWTFAEPLIPSDISSIRIRGLDRRTRRLARSSNRSFSCYGAYNPAILQRYLEIYRTYYNYCLRSKDKKTPAMRLDLTKAPFDPHAILHFG